MSNCTTNKVFFKKAVSMNSTHTIPIKEPKIVDGWWENDKGEEITLSQEGSKVKMVISTLNIEDGATVKIIIYKNINWALDDNIGTFTTTVNKNKASILITLIEDQVIDEDNKIEELYFKVKITHNCGVEEKTLPLIESKYLQVVKKAVLVSIFVEMPQSLTNSEIKASNDTIAARANDLGLSGHAGIAIDGEYYDYGPSGAWYSSQGEAWWDGRVHNQKRGSVDMSKVGGKDLELLRKTLPFMVDKDAVIYENKILVTKKQAKVLKDWWDAKYKNPGTYSAFGIYGDHCTNTVMASLEKANIIGDGFFASINYATEVAEPKEFQEDYLNQLTHQAGYLINDEIPKDLTLSPPSKGVKVASFEKIKKEKVKL